MRLANAIIRSNFSRNGRAINAAADQRSALARRSTSFVSHRNGGQMYARIRSITDHPDKLDESSGKTSWLLADKFQFSVGLPPMRLRSEPDRPEAFLKLEAHWTDLRGTGERGGETLEIRQELALWLTEKD